MTRVLALTKYGREAASTRQRLLQFLPALDAAGFTVEVEPLLGDDYVRALATGEGYARSRLLAPYLDRFRRLGRAGEYDLLWAYAELFPGLPAPFERRIFAAGKPVIYDCDDAFFHGHEARLGLQNKLAPLLRGATTISAGNDYLAAYARRFNNRVEIIPTVVDTDSYRPRPAALSGPITIGWIGSPSTWGYVRPLLPLLSNLTRKGSVRFLAVGAGAAAASDLFEGMELRDWAEEREIADVQDMQIGIMPLPDEPWVRGKCGYKLLQYMACALPTVAAPIGVNSSIISDGETGRLASNEQEWRDAFRQLVGDGGLREKMGLAGRARVVAKYSLESWAPVVVDFFRQTAAHQSRAAAPLKRL